MAFIILIDNDEWSTIQLAEELEDTTLYHQRGGKIISRLVGFNIFSRLFSYHLIHLRLEYPHCDARSACQDQSWADGERLVF